MRLWANSRGKHRRRHRYQDPAPAVQPRCLQGPSGFRRLRAGCAHHVGHRTGPDIDSLEIMGLPWREKKACQVANASTVACILAFRPPRLLPRACLDPPFCTSAVLVDAHDGGINHGVFVVRVLSQDFKHPLLDTCLAPVQVTDVHDAKVAEMRWQIPPRNTCTVAVQHGVHEQSIVFCSGSGLTCLTR